MKKTLFFQYDLTSGLLRSHKIYSNVKCHSWLLHPLPITYTPTNSHNEVCLASIFLIRNTRERNILLIVKINWKGTPCECRPKVVEKREMGLISQLNKQDMGEFNAKKQLPEMP